MDIRDYPALVSILIMLPAFIFFLILILIGA